MTARPMGLTPPAILTATVFPESTMMRWRDCWKLFKLLKLREILPRERAAELASGIMGTNTNFSYYIMDEAGNVIVESGDDARDRIEASNHFMRIANISGELEVESGVPTTGLNRNAWQTALDECTNAYQIYTAVDNNLEREDTFYESYIDYQNLTEYFGIAKIVGIVAIVVFLVLLIFCVIATGMNRGYAGVRLTWFDRYLQRLL